MSSACPWGEPWAAEPQPGSHGGAGSSEPPWPKPPLGLQLSPLLLPEPSPSSLIYALLPHPSPGRAAAGNSSLGFCQLV